MLPTYQHHPSSYRDPSGFIFEKEGVLYRQVNKSFIDDFDQFISSGCYDAFIKKGLLISHDVIDENLTSTGEYYKTLKPEPVSFISYPYEWSFDMLKDAALLTLQLLKESINYGLILKDATPYNIQWHMGRLVFIDSLSFEKYNEQQPWIAYRQFCESFLSPLLLMHYSQQPLQQLQLAYPDGIPLAITKSLLPGKSMFSLHTYLHIHLHAKVSSKEKTNSSRKNNFSKQKLFNLISSLETLVNKLKSPAQNSTWANYYSEAAQRDDYLEEKQKLVQQWSGSLSHLKTAVDLGANDGVFSKLLAAQNIFTLSTDFDTICINNLYNEIKSTNLQNLQPLILDLGNPSPAIGVNNIERLSFINRTKVDLAIALAVIHHLVIGKNIPFEKTAYLFNQLSGYLIIEFVPKEDEKVQFMLKNKQDIYHDYTRENFELAFEKHYTIQNKQLVGGSARTLYLMKRNG
jgi:hypothetical protein